MSQEAILREALEKLLNGYKNKIDGFSVEDFLKTGVDPFRFTVNTSIWGLKKAIRKEVEHKVEMALENLTGDFHEDYLGNSTHAPTNTKWKKVPEGSIPGIDIGNEGLNIYLQIKSKHNSMNSSSASRLAQELQETAETFEGSSVGCAWIVAKQGRKAIGENAIAEVAECFKGKKAYAVVTGDEDELDNVLERSQEIIPEIVRSMGLSVNGDSQDEQSKNSFEALLDEAAEKVSASLEKMAVESNSTPIAIVTRESID